MKDHSQNKASSNFLKTDGGKTESNAIEIPPISLPKGGGALNGIDESYLLMIRLMNKEFNIKDYYGTTEIFYWLIRFFLNNSSWCYSNIPVY